MAEKSRRWSPYVYCYDNPIRFIDPDGMEAVNPDDKKKNKPEYPKPNTPNPSANVISISGGFKMTTGKVGVKFTIAGIQFEASYSIYGGASQGFEAKGSLSADKDASNVQVEHKQSTIDKSGFTFKFGSYGGEESTITETTRTLSNDKGAQKKTESNSTGNFSVGPITIDDKKTSINSKSGIELNFLLIGVGAEAGMELTAPK